MDVNHTHSGNFIRCEVQLKAAKHHMSFRGLRHACQVLQAAFDKSGKPYFGGDGMGDWRMIPLRIRG